MHPHGNLATEDRAILLLHNAHSALVAMAIWRAILCFSIYFSFAKFARKFDLVFFILFYISFAKRGLNYVRPTMRCAVELHCSSCRKVGRSELENWKSLSITVPVLAPGRNSDVSIATWDEALHSPLRYTLFRAKAEIKR